MKNSESMEKNVTTLIEKEFWGILLLEMSLPALLKLLNIRSLGVGLSRLADWVLFPDKIPLSYRERIVTALEKRATHPKYELLQNYEMNEWEKALHGLVTELLYLKVRGENADPSQFRYLYLQPFEIFYSLSIQMVERKYVPAQKMMLLFQHYNEKKRNKGADDE
ncbi:hypothetical protein ABEV55_16220 [Aneurinibacillus thermoaerophilus]|uniref:hypothetical protein n=1 Tax=Aneurinibacillus thermoaerophilus TaxID=143495 RepID=UPI002E1CC0AC|nr:hypothetical protein [Aneurinibacillus thermoaerophilus]